MSRIPNDIETGPSRHDHPLLRNGSHDSRQGVPSSPLQDLRTILFSAYINVLLLFVPFALLSGALGWPSSTVFATNFFALMPLASLLSYSTEELSKRVGRTTAGLLNVTFGNATELIVGIVALRDGQIKLIQTAMLGSILSSLLFILGTTFVVGGMRYAEFEFSGMVAQTMSSLMFVATGSLILPAAFEAALPHNSSTQAEVLALSRGTALVLLVIYLLYLVFQLKTHTYLFEPTPCMGEVAEEDPEPDIGLWASAIAVFSVTTAIAFCSDYLVGSIDDVVAASGVSKTFIGLILIPMVGNAAETVTAINLGYKNKFDLAIGVTIGSSIQISLFLTPFLVIMGWIMDKPMTLNFEIFQAVVIFVSVIFTEYLIMDGKSNWMEGAMLLGVYLIVGISYWVYPDIDTGKT